MWAGQLNNVLIFSLVLFFAMLATFYVDQFFALPEYIPNTPIKLYGFIFCSLTLLILTYAEKSFLKANGDITIAKLTLLGATVCFIAETQFQWIRIQTFDENRLYLYLRGITTNGIFFFVLAFLIAFQLKTKRSGLVTLFVIVIFILFKIALYFFPEISSH